MPVAVPIIGAAAFSAFSITAAGAIAFSWATFGVSLVIGALSYALTPKPKSPNNPLADQGSTVTIRQSDMSRQWVYGHTRITRGFGHMESTGLNGNLHLIIILCEGPLRDIPEVWLNDYSIPWEHVNEDGLVTDGRYNDNMYIYKHLGTETQSADPLAVDLLTDWTVQHKLSGIAYLYIVLNRDIDVFPNGVPNITAIVEGPTVYDPRVQGQVWNPNMALAAHDFLTNERYGFGVLPDDIDEDNTAAQANICDEFVDTLPEDHILDSVNPDRDTINMTGVLMPFQWGDRVELVGGGTPPGGLSTGVDYYVIPYQIKTVPRIRLATSFQNSLDKIYIDLTSNVIGEIYLRKNGEPRYHGGGAIDAETPLSQTLNTLVSSMAGRAVNVGGFWTLQAGAWREPDVTLGIGDIRGSGLGFKNALSMSESFNMVKGLFISSVTTYQGTDYPSAVYQDFIDEDNGIEAARELNLPFTNRATTAQRIAKIELFRGRQGIVVKSDFSTKGIQVKPGDTVALDIDRLGWSEKNFEVTEFALDVAEGNLVTRMTLRETAEEIYDWTAGEAIGYDPAPNTDLPNPFLVYAVTGVFYNSRIIDTRDGDVVYTLTLNWDQHPDAFVLQFGDFEVQYKLSSEPEWRPSFFVDGLLTQTDALNSSVNISYDIRIRARNSLGVRSAWTTIENAIVGYSGGVTTNYDWDYVYNAASVFNDWGNVYDAPTVTDDWGYVI